MLVFQDLKITIPKAKQKVFLDAMEKRLPLGWTRNNEAEVDLGVDGKENVGYFMCDKSTGLPPALVALYEQDENSMYVSNIVPVPETEITTEEYNKILSVFNSSCIAPVAVAMKLQVKLSLANQTLQDWIPNQSYDLFETAVMYGYPSHPLDRKKWYNFVISLARSKKYDLSYFVDWLIQEKGFDKVSAHNLNIELVHEVELLKLYRKR